MKVLLAGAAGYIGQRTIKALTEAGHEVYLTDIRADRLKEYESIVKKIFSCDLRNKDDVRGICANIDAVISTVGLEFPQKNLSYYDVDYQCNIHLLNEAREAGVKKFIYISVLHADTAPEVPLLKAKSDFEKELMKSSLQWVILRPSGYFKDIINIFMKMARKGKVNLVGDGSKMLNPIHPDDMASLITQSLQETNKTISAGGKEIYSYKELAEICFKAAGNKSNIKYMSPLTFKIISKILKIIKPNLYPIMQFSLWTMTHDLIGDKHGAISLKKTIEEL